MRSQPLSDRSKFAPFWIETDCPKCGVQQHIDTGEEMNS